MTVKVFYEYNRGAKYPFIAKCWIGEKQFLAVSHINFDEAERELLGDIRACTFTGEVPEPKEVEV